MIYGAQPINAYTSVKWAEETMLHGAILATEDQNTLIEQSALTNRLRKQVLPRVLF